MARNVSKNVLDLESLEKEAAASILIYDGEELETFLDLYNGTVSDNSLGISGPFSMFLKIITKAFDEGIFNNEEDTEDIQIDDEILIKGTTKEQRLINYILKSNEHGVYSKDERDKFKTWFSSVLNSNIDQSLAEDIINHYLWENYKSKVDKLDKSDDDFKSKINAIPKPLFIKDSKSSMMTLNDIDISYENDSNRKYTTGIDALDKEVLLKGTNFMVIAARPGVGKSLFMLQQAIENARGGKIIGVDGQRLLPKKSLFISLEMNQTQVHDRILSYLAMENLKEYKYERYVERVNEIKQKEEFKTVMENLHILEVKIKNGESILTSIEQAIDQHGIECFFLDYLQLLNFTGQDKWGSIREATNALKSMAFVKNVLAVTGSQVSRASTEEGLGLTDLFGGASIEADADVVIGMESLRERRSTSNTNTVNIKVLKNREGALVTSKTDIDYSCGLIKPMQMDD